MNSNNISNDNTSGMYQKDNLGWEKEIREKFNELSILEDNDLELYLILLKSKNELTGSEISKKLPDLKRTHVYSILNRLQEGGWIELTNPNKRPALYRGINPSRALENIIKKREENVKKIKDLHVYIKSEVEPLLNSEQLYGGRISNTFVIPTISELYRLIIEHLKQAEKRIMMHVSAQLFSELQEPILNAITKTLEMAMTEGVRNSSEYRRDHFPIVIVGMEEEEQEDEIRKWKELSPVLLIFEKGVLAAQLIVIDDNVFINNVGTGFGLALRILDTSTASVYATMLTQTFIEKECELLGKSDINLIGKALAENDKIRNLIEKLFDQGWKMIPDHSMARDYEMGIVAPGTERHFYRICAIQFHPFTKTKSKEEQVKELYEFNLVNGKIYINRIKRQFMIIARADTVNMFGQEMYVLKITFKVKKEWIPIVGETPKLESVDINGEAIVSATFNFEDQGALCVWGINPDRVKYILDLLFEEN